jgi:rhodanese-related sulfurtransferase
VSDRPLTIREALPHFQSGAGLLDTRPKADYIQAHIPGSSHLEADDQLSSRISFIFPPDVPVILLLTDPAGYERVVYSLARVGYDSILGYLAEGLDVWQKMGLPLTAGDVRDVEPVELHNMLQSASEERPIVVDVREPWEYQRGHVPGALLIPLGQLSSRLGELDTEQPVALICQTGSRSLSAAALLGQKGFKTIYNVAGGTSAWKHSGLALEK